MLLTAALTLTLVVAPLGDDARAVLDRLASSETTSDEVRVALEEVGTEDELFQLLVEVIAAPAAYTGAQRQGLVAALAARPGFEGVLTGLDATSPFTAREAGFELLLQRPSVQSVELALGWLDGPPTSLDQALRSLVKRSLEEDPRAADQCRDLLKGDARPSLLLGVSDWNDPRVLVLLSGCLFDNHPQLPLALEVIGARAADLGAVDETLRAEIRRHLDDSREGVAEAAARACASLRDTRAAEALVALLDSERTRVRSSACAALRTLSGVTYGPDAARWGVWLRQERRWWSARGEALIGDLHHGAATVALEALAEAARHPLYAEELAGAVAPYLSAEHEVLRRVACAALEDLGARGWAHELVPLLDDRSLDVREASLRALRALTAHDLPADPTAWREWMENRR